MICTPLTRVLPCISRARRAACVTLRWRHSAAIPHPLDILHIHSGVLPLYTQLYMLYVLRRHGLITQAPASTTLLLRCCNAALQTRWRWRGCSVRSRPTPACRRCAAEAAAAQQQRRRAALPGPVLTAACTGLRASPAGQRHDVSLLQTGGDQVHRRGDLCECLVLQMLRRSCQVGGGRRRSRRSSRRSCAGGAALCRLGLLRRRQQ
jgi:hypothetical protein